MPTLEEQIEAMKKDKARLSRIKARIYKIEGEKAELQKERQALIAKYSDDNTDTD